MSRIKEHYHDQIIAAQRETLVDDSGAEPVNKKFFRLGKEYICIDYDKKEVFICRQSESTTHLKLWRGDLYVNDIQTYKKLTEISREEFTEHFNSVAEQMQNLKF